MEVYIGRQIEGQEDILVDSLYGSVSRKHCKFIMNEQGVFVEDLSSNGTFVNGKRVKMKKVVDDDKITLGIDSPPYKVNVGNVVAKLNMLKNANKTDFSQEFLALKKVYEDYEKELDKVVLQLKMKNILPRIVLTLIVIVIIMKINLDSTTKMVLSMGAGVVGMAASVFGVKDSKGKKKREAIRIKYNRKYVCPKCQTKLYIGRKSWDILYEEGKCVNAKCNAKFR